MEQAFLLVASATWRKHQVFVFPSSSGGLVQLVALASASGSNNHIVATSLPRAAL